MRTTMVDITKIRNRKISQSRTSATDSKYFYNLANSAIVRENNSLIKSETEKFFKNCIDKNNAGKYFKSCVSIMEKVEPSILKSLSHIFSTEVVPAITDLDSVKECIECSSLDITTKEKILNAIKENKVCDRVISNSKNISSRFNLEKIVKESIHLPIKEPIFECCKLIDTYDMPAYGKLNLAIEQLSYYLQMEGVKYDRSELVKYIVEYFTLTNSEKTDKDFKGFRNVLQENMFLEDCDSKDCGPLAVAQMNDYAKSSNPIQNTIQVFCNTNGRTYGDLQALVDIVMNQPTRVIISNIGEMLEFFRTLILLEEYPSIQVKNITEYFFDSLFDKTMSRDDIEDIWKSLQAEIKIVQQLKARTNISTRLQAYNMYADVLDGCIDSVGYSLGTLYPEKTVQSNKDWNSMDVDHMTLQEFKIFKFQNLITAVMNLDKFLNRKGNKFLDIIKKKSKKIFSSTKKFFTESGDIDFSNISSNGTFDVCIAVYEANSETDTAELNSVFSQLCDALNNSFDNLPKGSRVNYVNIANRFEIHYEDSTVIDMSAGEEIMNESTMSEYDIFNSATIKDIETFVTTISAVDLDKTMHDVGWVWEIDKVAPFIECLQFTGLVTLEDVKTLASNYSKNHCNNYSGNTKLAQIVSEWTCIDDIPYGIRTEAVACIQGINEKVDLNSVKLAIEGLKSKMKDLGAKEKEMSRNLDINMNHFMNSMKRAMTNDRREAIIKGSIIPSFSKSIKICLGLAGVAAFNPALALIGAFAGLAVSKNLNAKERRLMLDEIDIELKALEKEIQLAEDSKNMKKYRQLLTYQKKLQREKQRIKYNIKVSGANDVPDSSMGTAYGKD